MKDAAIVVTKTGLGTTAAGDAAFGVEMLDKMFHTLERMADKPAVVCFYTEGVKLLAPDSPLALSVRLLERLGIRLLACQSCLEYYGITEIVAGERRGMVEILEALAAATKVITV